MREVYSEGYCCLLKTDIASYFEQIDHGIFIDQILNGKVRDGEIIYLLRKLLTKWAVSEVKHIGIPIGCDASSYIGNVYLRDVDKIMIRRGFKYFRYSDEILILTKSEREAKKAISELIHQLRNLHLNLQEAKTRIMTDPDEIAVEIGSNEDDKTKVLDYEFGRRRKVGKQKESEEVIIRYKEATKNGKAKVNEIDVPKFKWCINKLSGVKSDRALSFILGRLADFSFLSDFLFEYLTLFVNRQQTRDPIIGFLRSADNIYEWQEMWLLLSLSQARKLDDGHLGVLRDIAIGQGETLVTKGGCNSNTW